MRIQIGLMPNGEDIICNKEYYPIKDKGEIAHFLMEIKIIEKELMELWDEENND